ncbi:hypothetical protein [Flavobacterium sp.]|uniref:hypothetical protein n=1 Tax=Flavobacterium sp. TaxID=239 RepID=UPI0038FC88E0
MGKLSVTKINKELLRFDDHDLDDEFLGVAVLLDHLGNPKHTGLALCFEGEKLFFHFNGEVLLDDVTDSTSNIYYKKLEIFPDSYLTYIRGHFDLLLNTVTPLYGFVFTDSFYDEFGTYVSEIENLPDFCTCVGFCINVIRSLFLKPTTKYIEINDWTNESLEKVSEVYIEMVDKYLLLVKELNPQFLPEIKKKNYKRIAPTELLLSGFLAQPKKLPVRKSDINPHVLETRKILKEKWIASED